MMKIALDSTTRRQPALAIALMLTLATGCAGPVKNMEAVEPPPPLPAGMARIVFMRPSSTGYAIQSSVFELVEGAEQLVGIVPAKAKIAFDVAPGEHQFMVVGEAADFMSAHVVAGRTYYALVTPRMGVWKARFGLRPVHQREVEDGHADKWLGSCSWVATNEASARWAIDNANSIEAKRAKYWPVWIGKPEAERPHLGAGDGRE